MSILTKIFGEPTTYPIEWEKQEPVNLERTVERKKYEIMLENGEEIVTEADEVKITRGSRYFHDVDAKLVTSYGNPRLRTDKEDVHLELKEEEIAAVRPETVSKRKYVAKDVEYKTRQVEDYIGYRTRHSPRIKDEAQIVGNPEIKRQEINQ